MIKIYRQLKEEIGYIDNYDILFPINRIDNILLKGQRINVEDRCSIQQFKICNSSPFFYSFYYTLYYEDGQGYRRNSIDELYTIFFIKYIILFIEYCSFFVFQRIKTEIEFYILLIFDQQNLYYMFFRYIDQALVFLDLGVFFVDLLKNVSFLKIFQIDVYTVFHNDVKGVLGDLHFQIGKFRSNRRLF